MIEDRTRFRRLSTEWGAAALVFVAAMGMLILFGRSPRHRQARELKGPAPDLAYTLPSGQSSSVAKLKGKVVLLNFWASWCLPCMEEMSSLRQLEDKLSVKGFELLALNVDGESSQALRGFPETDLPRQLIFSFDLRQLDRFSLDVIPLSVLIDRQGEVKKRYVGPRDWTSPSVLSEISEFL